MKGLGMQQQISIITIGVADLARSKHFYGEGFGWSPVFENEEIIFFQMNGLMLGCFLKPSLEADMGRPLLAVAGAYSLAHNVESEAAVIAVMNRLAQAGGRIVRPADAPLHGGFRGYVADPDDHAWEIAFNPAWTIDAQGHVTFGI
jgi:hypothetical protein